MKSSSVYKALTKGMPERQLAFCKNIVSGMNQTRAYLAAGYGGNAGGGDKPGLGPDGKPTKQTRTNASILFHKKHVQDLVAYLLEQKTESEIGEMPAGGLGELEKMAWSLAKTGKEATKISALGLIQKIESTKPQREHDIPSFEELQFKIYEEASELMDYGITFPALFADTVERKERVEVLRAKSKRNARKFQNVDELDKMMLKKAPPELPEQDFEDSIPGEEEYGQSHSEG